MLHNVVGTVTMNMEQLAFTYLDTVSKDASGAFVSLPLLQNVCGVLLIEDCFAVM